MKESLFGLPFFKSKIENSRYNKDIVIRQISENFVLDPSRNNWDQDQVYSSKLHHAVNDFNNPKFNKINFDQLIPLYQEEIIKFFDTLSFKKDFEYEFKIANYTCMTSGNFMKHHDHASEFVAVHYLKFNKIKHKPTIFCNGNGFADHIVSTLPNLKNILDDKDIKNSWINEEFCIDTEEDDFVISPGVLRHFVPPFDQSDELRITIVINILMREKNENGENYTRRTY